MSGLQAVTRSNRAEHHEGFRYPWKAYLIYRYFPLAGHAYGRVSAQYVCAAAQLGKYRQASEVLFARQSTWSLDGKVAEAVDTVLTAPEQKKVRALLKDPAVQSQIAHDVAEGRSIPVQQTPTMVVTSKGRQYPLSPARECSTILCSKYF